MLDPPPVSRERQALRNKRVYPDFPLPFSP
jgi:hypothetical protein